MVDDLSYVVQLPDALYLICRCTTPYYKCLLAFFFFLASPTDNLAFSILRKKEIKSLFPTEMVEKILEVRSDVGNTWFVTFLDEDVTQDAFFHVRQQTFDGKKIQARVKSENLLKSLYHHRIALFLFLFLFLLLPS